MGWRLLTRQGVDVAYGRPDIVSHWCRSSGRLSGLSNHREPWSGVYKAPHDPRLLKRPLPLAQLVRHALRSLSQSTYFLLQTGDLVFDGFHMPPTNC
jgi:hypothetical protein